MDRDRELHEMADEGRALMRGYIKREDALKEVTKCADENQQIASFDASYVLLHIPSADVAPVRNGRWVTTYRYGFPIWECSECGTQTGTANFPYCYNCGAKMDEEENDGNQ